MLWDQEKKTPSYQRIIFWVVVIHGIFIALLYFKNVANNTHLKPKLIVKNFLEKSLPVKNTVKNTAKNIVKDTGKNTDREKKKASVVAAVMETAAPSKNKPSDGLWQQKREEFFKEKLDSFSDIKKAKEQARKKAKEKAETLVKADRQLRARNQNSQALNKRSLEKKTFQKVLKKKPVVIAAKSGKKSSLKDESLRKKREEQLKKLRASLAKLESFQKDRSLTNTNTNTQTLTQNQNQNNKKQSKNILSSAKALSVPELKKGSWTTSLIFESSSDNSSDSSLNNASDLFADQGEEHAFKVLFLDHLKEQLQLPEVGEVKLQMTLSPEGRVVKVAVLRAQNQGNKEYLEEVLPTLAFPFLKNYLKKEKSFMITFLNEEQD